MNSEDEKQWNPFEEEDMDENVSKAFEELQKNPDKWMKKMEEEIDDSESEEESEEEESAEEEEEKEGSEEEKEEEKKKESEPSEEPKEQDDSEHASEDEESASEAPVNEKEIKKQQKREQLKEQKQEEKKAVKAINPNLSMFVLFLSFTCSFVKNVSFDYQEDSFRNLFKGCGAISMLFMVHRNDGRFASYG